MEYLHSDIKTVERTQLIQGLRKGEFDVLVGINLLREGLDIPEVSLVAVMDADKEGFLRSERSLIQTAGRAARNIHGLVILYADKLTGSMKRAISETERRRNIQEAYNKVHGIEPKTIVKDLEDALTKIYERDQRPLEAMNGILTSYELPKTKEEIEQKIKRLEKDMYTFSKKLEFEQAAKIRDEITKLKEALLTEV